MVRICKNHKEVWLSERIVQQGDCLVLTGATSGSGYSKKWFNGKQWDGHRLAYYQHTGIHPGKFQVCHSCDNKPCVNPEHLWLGTAKQNAEDKSRKKRHNNQKKTHCKFGHEFTAENTAYEASRPDRRKCRKCERSRSKWRWANRNEA